MQNQYEFCDQSSYFLEMVHFQTLLFANRKELCCYMTLSFLCHTDLYFESSPTCLWGHAVAQLVEALRYMVSLELIP
jgi:hypothetical protein